MEFKEINPTKIVEKKQSEPARQFEEIFKEHHSKEGKEAIKYIKNRKSRVETIIKDTGI